ncbi:hypothetical protein EVAR_92958_1 [Eumeta japonica]|uniref:Uncharacterized protein n=1 Tax=Eumeta variegata TaxID=151549 RepID=A0A4C1TAD9_EUMVA|nr:hypothetical protein EVAR_92958_1 [Eumeta japonica]
MRERSVWIKKYICAVRTEQKALCADPGTGHGETRLVRNPRECSAVARARDCPQHPAALPVPRRPWAPVIGGGSDLRDGICVTFGVRHRGDGPARCARGRRLNSEYFLSFDERQPSWELEVQKPKALATSSDGFRAARRMPLSGDHPTSLALPHARSPVRSSLTNPICPATFVAVAGDSGGILHMA